MGHRAFYHRFSTERKCFQALRRTLYGGRPVRCTCGGTRPWRGERPNGCRLYTCRFCRRKWSDLKGTIFERSRTPLSKWFMALYEIAHGPGISARHLQVRLSVSYKTAWRMLHQIRRALREEQLSLVLTGVVEADETYLGGRRKGPRGRGARGKTPVVGLAQRAGPLVALTLPDVSRKSLHASIRSHVRPGARLVTDEWPGYSRLRAHGYRHHRVLHEETYVKGQKHTNTVEGFWSLLKRRIRAIHTKVSQKYLDYYLAEASFRYNLRLQPDRLKATFQACLVPLRG